MYIFNTITIKPKLPNEIKGLEEISQNLWWSWNTDYLKLFKYIDEILWNEIGKNPVKFLKEVSQQKLDEVVKNQEFISLYNKVYSDFKAYMTSKNTYFANNMPEFKDKCIAYFSAEYGIDQTLPLYSGGLGVLSGDHLKSASDLGIPLVGIGLIYKQGFFKQRIDAVGRQITEFGNNDIKNMPLNRVKGEDGKDISFAIKIEGQDVLLKVWKLNVGRVKLYLLDADVFENSERFRELSFKLYGGGREMRIMQEMILGIGGVKLLDILGIKADVYHMNEGHSAFLIIELISKIMKERNVSFEVAKTIVKSMTAFTTHTPVPAGNDIFDTSLVERVFEGKWNEIGISKEEFLKLGSTPNDNTMSTFNMGVFALKFAGKRNGVSKLHGEVSKDLFTDVWPNTANDESPITYVTNGVHTCTWLAPDMKKLFNKKLIPFWQDKIHENDTWKNIYNVEDEELLKVHRGYKKRLIKMVNENIREKMTKNGATYDEIHEMIGKLNEDDLIIGFARRFATYKRATIIFEDLERLTQILNDEKRPVRLIFAGKAHPADTMGQNLIKKIEEISKMPQFRGKVILLENYNMGISRLLVSGVDVWMNNPRRPFEACGTSGQKAAINGVVNFSVLDGWWDEGYDGTNGFAIGGRKKYSSDEEQDRSDSQSIYEVLENKIIPTYYDQNEQGISKKWVEYMKNSIATNAGRFSTARMLIDYLNKIYLPLVVNHDKYFKNLEEVFSYLTWKKMIKIAFASKDMKIYQDRQNQIESLDAGEELEVELRVNLPKVVVDGNEFTKEDIEVQAYVVKILSNGETIHTSTTNLNHIKVNDDGTHLYKGKISINNGGNFGYTFRIVPKNERVLEISELDTAKWFVKEEEGEN